VVRAEPLATAVAVELIAAGAEHLAAFGISARADFEDCVAAIFFVVLDRKTFEKRVAGGAGSRGKSRFHDNIIAKRLAIVKCNCDSENKAVSYFWMARRKNPAAVALGRRGGKARLTKLTPEQRSEIARKAGKAGGRGRKKAD